MHGVDVSDDMIEFATEDEGIAGMRKAFDLEKIKEPWGQSLREASKTQFSEGGNRVVVPLLASDRHIGLIILGDRVNGVAYTMEELELLECIGDQVASSLLNLRLAKEIMLGKELEAFQTISTFFVHDLKNAASTLNLTLQNLPVHFDDPVFRQDTLRSIGTTTERINQIIAEYLHALDTGKAPDRQEFLARHPELASELAAFFADRDQFEHLARPLDAAGFRPGAIDQAGADGWSHCSRQLHSPTLHHGSTKSRALRCKRRGLTPSGQPDGEIHGNSATSSCRHSPNRSRLTCCSISLPSATRRRTFATWAHLNPA